MTHVNKQLTPCSFSRFPYIKETKFTSLSVESKNLPDCSDQDNKKAMLDFLKAYDLGPKLGNNGPCSFRPPCTHNKYKVDLAQSPGLTNKTDLLIRMSSSTVEYVQDSYTYVFINLIGEVSGILSLMWGLSVLTVIDVIDYLTTKLQKRLA